MQLLSERLTMINTKQSPYTIIKGCESTKHVFHRYGLSPKNITPLDKIAKKTFSNYNFFVDLLNSYEKIDESFVNVFEHYDLPIVTDYLKRSHDYYLRVRLPEIENIICKKINKSPKNQPILFVLHEFFLFYKSDLKEHFNEEEALVFPLANHLHNLEQNPNDQKSIFWISQHKERALSFIKSHKKEDSDLREINSAFLSYKNSIPETAAAHEVLLKEFHEFQKDMKIHERIEDFVFSKKVHQLLKNFNTRIN